MCVPMASMFVIFITWFTGVICFDRLDFRFNNAGNGRFIRAGKTVAGMKSIRDLQTGEYNVEASGLVENFSKWVLFSEGCHPDYGWVNVNLPNVKSGEREGFASHKAGGTTSGTMVHCSMSVDEDILIQFTYVVPYNYDFSRNWLSIAVCEKSDRVCRGLNAERMYYNQYPFMTKMQYTGDKPPIVQCYDNFCLVAVMTSNHKPIMVLRVYPVAFFNLSPLVREGIESDGGTRKGYEDHLKKIYGKKILQRSSK